MNILTIGLSPYLLLSQSKIHSLIIQRLSQFHIVSSMVWFHDKNYFPPENENGTEKFYYNVKEKKYPIIPFNRSPNDPITVYENISQLKPDIVLTIGSYEDFLFMHAVRMFSLVPFKWVFVLMNGDFPINEKNIEALNSIDSLVCTNLETQSEVQKYFKKEVCLEYVGYDSGIFHCTPRSDNDRIKVFCMAKNSQSEGIATLMQVVSEINGKNIELYLHTNAYDQGDYDLKLLKERLDPKNNYIRLPEEFVGLTDGIPDEELCRRMNACDIVVSIPMTAPSGLGLFEAMVCGCYPLLSNCGVHRDIEAKLQSNHLVKTFSLLTKGETYLNIVDPNDLKKRLKFLCKNRELLKGRRETLSESIREHTHDRFLDVVVGVVENAQKTGKTLNLEE